MINYKRLSKELERQWVADRKHVLRQRFWDGQFKRVVDDPHLFSISVCTTVMNRLEDLKKTLPRNIKDNESYPLLEFLVLDYGSTDGVGDWIKREMGGEIETGLLTYVRTDEPRKYSMTHSRNVAFRAARGEIVLSVDADSYTDEGFVEYVNRMANEREEARGAFFAKSRQLLRGRLGFFKRDFVEVLGGYDEELVGYGHDDMDIMNRALESGLEMMCFRKFCRRVEGHEKHATPENYEEAWWVTEGKNRLRSYANLLTGRFRANEGRAWGKARLMRNFKWMEET